jgi:hypothetical protein
MRWGQHVARTGYRRSAHKVLVRRLEGKIPHGSPKHIWEDNIGRYLKEI